MFSICPPDGEGVPKSWSWPGGTPVLRPNWGTPSLPPPPPPRTAHATDRIRRRRYASCAQTGGLSCSFRQSSRFYGQIFREH